MIEDFDGPDSSPSRRGHVLVVSFVLLLGVVLGYAAVSTPELRGPYATPRPGVVAPRVTSAPDAINSTVAPTVQFAIPVTACYKIALPRQSTVFVSGRAVTLFRPAAEAPPGIDTIIAVTTSGTGLMWNSCAQPRFQTAAEPLAR